MSEHVDRAGWLNLDSDASDVNVLLHHLNIILEGSCLDEKSAFQLKSAVMEVVNNRIQHAYHNEPGNPIDISYQLEHNRVRISICDRGHSLSSDIESDQSEVANEPSKRLGKAKALVCKFAFEHQHDRNFCHLEKCSETAD